MQEWGAPYRARDLDPTRISVAPCLFTDKLDPWSRSDVLVYCELCQASGEVTLIQTWDLDLVDPVLVPVWSAPFTKRRKEGTVLQQRVLQLQQQNSYSISHLLGTVTTQWLPLWWCSHCPLVPDTVTTEQWLHRGHTLLYNYIPIHYHGAYVEICLLGT